MALCYRNFFRSFLANFQNYSLIHLKFNKFFSKISVEFQNKPTKFINYIWPINSAELPKFLSITLLMFCILCIQNLIRALKDSIVNTMIGPETISFLKFWGVMPAAFCFTIVYVKLVSSIKSEYIFYLIISLFLTFFALFAFYIFPNHQLLHLSTDHAQQLISNYPNFKWFILLLSNWSFSLFYIIAELWPNVVFALLFWQFVNTITNVEESTRFYPLFGLLGQTGLYVSGQFLSNLADINQYFALQFNLSLLLDHVLSIQIILITVLILGIIALFIFWLLNHKILEASAVEQLKFKPGKIQVGLRESLRMVLSSRYIMLITILLVCYGLAINLVEGPWKAMAAKVYTTPTEFASFVGGYLKYTGIFTVGFVILGSSIVRTLGWYTAAIITPIMVLVTGLLFFTIANFQVAATLIVATFVFTDPAVMAVTIGAIQNVLSKSSKYTLFDSTKEMSYVPLDDDLKTKGKAAADVIGTKIGKSTSALLQSLIFMILPTASYQSISIYLMMIFTMVCVLWIWGVGELDTEYKTVIEKTNK
ncbi:NTP/NDP exchange transporter Tlc4 [Candidatus Trichorickettsia mobilis]|uniref:ADP,ATP carrier protein n=1 Tax=Candidatus Trichorickettsia mobilis TaxID=1346319 RepID=A0ABZ0UQT0_9RICK|nr:Npt1/Npt2 family nucleotide transporter [Candidatus Trichorickettsia mobilis]WPY00171.1 NTP/NDP exchange transporter Tlc4 [Candidatus Trichorickettsia mobilis]